METWGPFELLKKLAEGGMAVTWLARRRGDEPGGEFVLKRILPKLADDRELQALFGEEARVAMGLVHDNVVRTWDHGQVDGEDYLLMEYVWGEDLRRIVERGSAVGKPLPLRFAVAIIARAARGLHFAHTQIDAQGRPMGLVHRDVSPPNLMVGFDGRVKVVDFGIAKAESHYMNVRPGQLKGKFSYMSPEQVQGLEVDHRSDLFALGTILYELTTSRRLFKADSDILTIKQISSAKVDPPAAVRPDYPPRLAEIVMKALAREPRDRYQSAARFADDLEAFLKENRLDARAEQLGSYLREIFPDRLEELNQLIAPDYAGPSREPRRIETAPAAPPPPRRTEESAEPPRDEAMEEFRSQESSSRMIYVGVAVVVLAMLGFMAWTMARQGSVGNPAVTEHYDTGPRKADLPPVETPSPVAPATVRATVGSEPAGAAIIVNGIAARKRTPAEVDLVQGRPNTIQLVLDGHETLFLNTPPADGAPISATLRPAAVPPPPQIDPEMDVSPPDMSRGRIRVEVRDAAGAVTGAEVLLNGFPVEGTSPVEFDVRSNAEQHITVRLAGYRDSVATIRAIPWQSEVDTRVLPIEVTKQRDGGPRISTIRLRRNPSDARVALNGEPQSADLFNVEALQLHTLRVEAPDHEPFERSFDARAGIVEVHATLVPIRREPAKLTMALEPEGTVIYATPLFRPGASANTLGTTRVDALLLDAGEYEFTVAFRNEAGRQRAKFRLTLDAGTAYDLAWKLEGETATELRRATAPFEP